MLCAPVDAVASIATVHTLAIWVGGSTAHVLRNANMVAMVICINAVSYLLPLPFFGCFTRAAPAFVAGDSDAATLAAMLALRAAPVHGLLPTLAVKPSPGGAKGGRRHNFGDGVLLATQPASLTLVRIN